MTPYSRYHYSTLTVFSYLHCNSILPLYLTYRSTSFPVCLRSYVIICHTAPNQRKQKIVLVGNSVAGKTCLLNSFLYKQFNPNQVPDDKDLSNAEIQIHDKPVHLHLCDTNGCEAYYPLRPLDYVNADVILICFSVDDPEAIKEVTEKWMPEVQHHTPRCRVILVACKTDLRTDAKTIEKLQGQDAKLVTFKLGRKTATKIRADAYLECSAKTGEGVEDLFVHATLLGLRKHSQSENVRR